MDSPMLSPTGPPRHRRRFSCRRIDRMCCSVLSYFPLVFVCGTTTWAVYTYSWSICWTSITGLKGTLLGLMGLVLYFMANWSYLTAVFTHPGSPADNKHAPPPLSITVKSTGGTRFCKKCARPKPDRTHHCSTCNTCILKMDHHCPWLSTCLGLHNYKPFLLFLIYTTLLCILAFTVSGIHVYNELLSNPPAAQQHFGPDDFTPVNWVLLCVIAGIIGLVLGGFTIWHLTLVAAGMTTIESLEKVRYTVGRRPEGARMYGGEEEEREAEVRRYNAYVLEEHEKALPHPFDLGRARNFRAVFGGSEEWWMWGVPVWSGIGDGWEWETSAVWRVAAEKVRVERERMGVVPLDESVLGEREPRRWRGGNVGGLVRAAGSKAERVLGKVPGGYSDGENVPLQRMHRDPGDLSGSESEEDEVLDLEAGLRKGRKTKMEARSAGSVGGWRGWEDNADDDKW